jgi:predicted transcriptional regulator
MNLTDEQIRFLRILADGKKKTYVHVARGFGMPLTPMAPTFTNRLAGPLRKRGLIRRAGGGYKITDKGLSALRSAGS